MPGVSSLCRASSVSIHDVPEGGHGLPVGRRNYPVLVLNGDFSPLSYAPLSLWTWQDSIKALFMDRVTAVAFYDTYVRSASLEMQVPSVVALKQYVQPKNPAFTRSNLFLRDGYECQYCGARGLRRELTLDHVHPRCLGGSHTWDNVVACCGPCNNRKGSLTYAEASQLLGMQLEKPPAQPSYHELRSTAIKLAHARNKAKVGRSAVRSAVPAAIAKPKAPSSSSSSSSSSTSSSMNRIQRKKKPRASAAATEKRGEGAAQAVLSSNPGPDVHPTWADYIGF